MLQPRFRHWHKSEAYWWSIPIELPNWAQELPVKWAKSEDISKLLGVPFGLSLDSGKVDRFLLERLSKKLKFWSSTRINVTGRTVVSNTILISSLLYFLAVWSRSGSGIKKTIAMIRNFLWAGTDRPSRARVAWRICCREKKDGGLGIIDPNDAVCSLMCKWVSRGCYRPMVFP